MPQTILTNRDNRIVCQIFDEMTCDMMREYLCEVREQDLTLRYVSFAFIKADGSIDNLSNYSLLSCTVTIGEVVTLLVDLLISGYISQFHLWLNIFLLI